MVAILNSAILDSASASWIQTPCYLLSESLKSTLTPLWLWLKLIQSVSNSFILTQLDDVSHLEFCHLEFYHLGFRNLSFSSQTHPYLPRLVPNICTEKTSLTLPSPPFAQKTFIHSFWLNLMMAAILNSAILDFRLLPFGFRLHFIFSQIHPKTHSLHSVSDSNFSFWLNLMMVAILNFAILNSAILDSASE